ncbi:MAG: glycosyltransferase family 39 protein [Chloroflexi bacterium]|nr:glycosyltransferase family 39 protein [Chloroflexota bacterium]
MTNIQNTSTLIAVPHSAPTVVAPARRATMLWHYLALVGVMCIALFFHVYQLDREGYGNMYYAAAVKSMSLDLKSFFFNSFDTASFVTVDKPPLGLWMQVFSVWLFGYSGISLMLPQVIAGVLSVALLYVLVRRVFGEWAGLIAALVLAVTPISIAANRNNTMDSQLVFTSLLAAWAISLAAERGKLRWLLLCAFFVGVGFNIKMLQAYMVLPAFYAVYFLTAATQWWKRIVHLIIATVLLIVVSFAWVVIVDLTPPESRPFIGSSTDNTVMELIVGHNGVARIGGSLRSLLRPGGTPPNQNPNPPQDGAPPNQNFNLPPNQNGAPPNRPPYPPPNQNPNPPQPPQGAPSPGGETGTEGIFRLFNQQLAGQATWLLPLALFSLIVLLARLPFTNEHRAALLWGAWLIPQVIFFSYAGLFHRYYLEMMAPAIAALVGAGVVLMWNSYRDSRWRGWLLPVALIIGAATEIFILREYADQRRWLTPLIGGVTVIVCVALIILKFKRVVILSRAFVVIGLLALLVAPSVWSATVFLGGDAGLPFAGPELLSSPRRGGIAPNITRLTTYLEANRGGAKFLAATMNANSAAPLIIETGEAVMTMGGFSGRDNILTAPELAERVKNNEVRFFLVPRQDNRAGGSSDNNDLTRWVNQSCRLIERSAWSTLDSPSGGGPSAGGGAELFDCKK